MLPEPPTAAFSPKATSSSCLAFCFQICQFCLLLCGFQWKDWLFWDASCTSCNKVVTMDPPALFLLQRFGWNTDIFLGPEGFILVSLHLFTISLIALICPLSAVVWIQSLLHSSTKAEGPHRIVERHCFNSLSLSVLMCKTEKIPAYPIEWFQVKGIASIWLKSICYSFGVLLCWCFNKKS